VTAPTAPDWPALGRRALAAGFAIADGVRIRRADGIGAPLRLYAVRNDGGDLGIVFYVAGWVDDPNFWRDDEWRAYVPDFSDAATLGVLEAQVRERVPFVAVAYDGRWIVYVDQRDGGSLRGSRALGDGPTLAEAWIAALEAAKGGER
jgi:hypothetical protein